MDEKPRLVEGEDYYLEGGMMVFTSRYHLRRGYCCRNDCRHCPYRERPATEDESDEDEKTAR